MTGRVDDDDRPGAIDLPANRDRPGRIDVPANRNPSGPVDLPPERAAGPAESGSGSGSPPPIGLSSRIAIAAYSALMRLVTPLYLLRLWRRGGVEPMYRERLGERLGFYDREPAGTGAVWVHAVSLGETRAAAALVDALRAEWPGMRLVLTHGTGTGREAGQELLRAGDAQAWLPWDTPGAARRFMRHWRPRVGVLIETEVWPNLLFAAQAAGVPMVLASARLSERSRRRGARVDAVLRPAAACVASVLAQTPADAARLTEAGARQVEVLGNLKFDLTPDAVLLARGQAWAAAIGRPVVLAASTREGEEAPLLEAWCRLPAPRPLLLVVPRHPQRFDEVAALVTGRGLGLARRSAWADGAAPPAEARSVDVWLGDSMREMPLYYGLAQAALLGGSFEPFGGQNLIEAAACGCPVVTGPHTFNFSQAAEGAITAGAAFRVADLSSGVDRAVALIGDPPARQAAAEHARQFAAAHRGAARAMAGRIIDLIGRLDRSARSIRPDVQ